MFGELFARDLRSAESSLHGLCDNTVQAIIASDDIIAGVRVETSDSPDRVGDSILEIDTIVATTVDDEMPTFVVIDGIRVEDVDSDRVGRDSDNFDAIDLGASSRESVGNRDRIPVAEALFGADVRDVEIVVNNGVECVDSNLAGVVDIGVLSISEGSGVELNR